MTTTDSRVDELHARFAATREDLDGAARPFTGQSDVKTRAGEAVRYAATTARNGRQQVSQVRESVQQRPGRWAGAGVGVLVLAAAIIGATAWHRSRQRLPRRATRALRNVAGRRAR